MKTPDGGKLNILVICDKPEFKFELEAEAEGSQLNLLFSPTVGDARDKLGVGDACKKTSGSDVRIVILPMCLNGDDTLSFAKELKRELVKRPVIALYPDVAFKDLFAGEVLTSWPREPLRVYAELKKLCGLY